MKNKLEYENFCRQCWRKYAKDPDAWFCSAEALKSAADILRNNGWPRNRSYHNLNAAGSDACYGPVYMLISGLAIETLIKGIMIAENENDDDNNLVEQQRLAKEITKHHLVELFQKTHIRKHKSDNDLLLRVQNYIETFGRYPVTKYKHDMAKRAHTHFCNIDFGKVDRFWNRLLAHYRQTMPRKS